MQGRGLPIGSAHMLVGGVRPPKVESFCVRGNDKPSEVFAPDVHYS